MVKKLSPCRIGLITGYTGLTAILFRCKPEIQMGRATTCLLLLFSVAVMLWLFRNFPVYGKKAIDSKRKKVAIAAIALFSSFAAFGYWLLSMDDYRMHAETDDILFFVLGFLWFVPVILALYILLEVLAQPKRNAERGRLENKTSDRFRTQFLIFGILCIIQCVFLFSFWPGGFGMDTVYEMQQVAGDVPLSDAHPAFWALTMRIPWFVFKNPAVYTAFQLFAFAWFVSQYLMFAWDSGLSTAQTAMAGALFIILPNQVMSAISVVKDFPFLLALMWGTLLLFRLIYQPEDCKGFGFGLQVLLSMFFMMGFRHNGICPALAEGIAVVVIALRGKAKKVKLISAPAAAVLLFMIIKGPVYSAMQVIPNTQTAYTPALCAVGAVVSKDLPLSEETHRILEKMMPLSDWRNYYSRFEGHDLYMWARGDGKTFDATKLTLWEVLRVYGEALIRYPDVVILDRLNGMDILWNFRQPATSFNLRYNDVIYDAEFTTDYFDVSQLENIPVTWYRGYVNHAGVSDLYRLSGTKIIILTDLFLWRGGAYLVLLMVCMLFVWNHRIKSVKVASIPTMANLLLSVLGVYQQSFRYIYFVQVMTIALCLLAVSHVRKEQRNLNQ